MSDLISRAAAIEALFDWEMTYDWDDHCREEDPKPAYIVSPSDVIEQLPSTQPEPCEYCNEDTDGYVKPIEKNNHAFVRFGANGWELSLRANGWHGSAKIRYCPMCGRDLYFK